MISIPKKTEKKSKHAASHIHASIKKTSKKDKKIAAAPKKSKDSIVQDQNSDTILDTYDFYSERIPLTVTIIKKHGEFVPTYSLQISAISKTTELILEKVRLELIRRVSLGTEDIGDIKKTDLVEDKFNELIGILIDKYFPDSDYDTVNFLRSYLKINSLGLGNIELLMSDETLEELVINQASEPAWVYHKKYGWLRTNVYLKNEEQTKHYASIIGRKVGRQITVLTPLLDAHLGTGDRVNATLSPVSTNGNTITIRKFSKDPWTITKFIKTKTIAPEAAALIWTAIQYELSALIAGGTASGKTSALNVFANFFPPNQRIISIEDTREIVLPKFLHWVPLNTTLPNAEGKGEINMGDLLVNSLRMRPDRILVGEVRRKRETETLFEAIHTGHSVYATFHANSAKETVERLTNAPLDVPSIMLPAISLVIVQFRNRRTGKRRTFQIAEIMPGGEANVIMQYDIKKDVLVQVSKSKALYDNISLFTGMSDSEISKELEDKVKVLNYLVDKNIADVDGVGRIVAEYYTNKDGLMKYVNGKKDFPLASQLTLEVPKENPSQPTKEVQASASKSDKKEDKKEENKKEDAKKEDKKDSKENKDIKTEIKTISAQTTESPKPEAKNDAHAKSESHEKEKHEKHPEKSHTTPLNKKDTSKEKAKPRFSFPLLHLKK
ncbi:MAG TPA: ATPase, T2SS/T4P/T4SS family [Alphaproteobacteria bacterium]|nr:ATPase, T2SS/T4P/T4SS family [Alphaproteobacteria bacterium]